MIKQVFSCAKNNVFLKPKKIPLLLFLLLIGGFTAIAAKKSIPVLDWDTLYTVTQQKTPPNIAKLNQKQIKIAGFMIPLEDEAENISEFLLVPTPMACIHVPAPPPNQIIHVFMKKKKRVPLIFYEPVWVTGTFVIQKRKNMYASSMFTMQGDSVEIYEPEHSQTVDLD